MVAVDVDALMDCPDHDCNGFLVRVNMPSQDALFRCTVCGRYFTKQTWTSSESHDENLSVIV